MKLLKDIQYTLLHFKNYLSNILRESQIMDFINPIVRRRNPIALK